ncbi:hypothetical protein EVAR_103757_1 [Eumeta japonica]|uniref:Uncharacterized protein n=1 Tax=Eumeta variegata TaxID=151549 RepID=A0A4C2A747_EUMVA|nr:hypothetical protein EVAR_103757_1 [Eumeta japonica]
MIQRFACGDSINLWSIVTDNKSSCDGRPILGIKVLGITGTRLIDTVSKRSIAGVKLLYKTIECASTDVLRIEEGVILSPPERDDLARLLQEYQYIFTQRGGPTQFTEQRIDIGDHPPVAVTPYCVIPAKKAIMEVLQDNLCESVIEESESLWAAPALLVPKKDAEYNYSTTERESLQWCEPWKSSEALLMECQCYKPDNLKMMGLLQTPIPAQRFEVVAVDLFGPLAKGLKGER